jgi:hypothetical protein
MMGLSHPYEKGSQERQLTFLRIVAADVGPLLWSKQGFVSQCPARAFEPIENEAPCNARSIVVRPVDFCNIGRVVEPEE